MAELYARLAASATREDRCATWLRIAASRVPGAVQGLLLVRDQTTGSLRPASHWPESAGDPRRLSDVCTAVSTQAVGLVQELPPSAGATPAYGLGFPLMIDDSLVAVVAVETANISMDLLAIGMQELQWSIGWLEAILRREQRAEDRTVRDRLAASVDLLAAVLAEPRFEAAAMTFVTELAVMCGCDRVSLGAIRDDHARVLAMSHSAQFGMKMNLHRAIVATMEEAIVQRCDLVWPEPPGTEPHVLRDHEALGRAHGAVAAMTIPTFSEGRCTGAITLERAVERPFTAEDVRLVKSVAALVVPALEEKRANDRWIIAKVAESAGNVAGAVFGSEHLTWKMLAMVCAGLAVILAQATSDFRLTASTALEGAELRAVVAPHDGYLSAASARAGDIVRAGAVMCRLDDRDLRLERLKMISQRAQVERQRQEAAASQDKAKMNVLSAQLDQFKPQLELIESQLERATLVAPLDGIVISGDLSQRLGGPVKQGEVLFEVAPRDAYRVVLKVDERRIGDVSEGLRGDLLLTALPHEPLPIVIRKITPVTANDEGRNVFRVEADLVSAAHPSRLRPGMEGVARVVVDRRRVLAIWTRDLVEWVRLTAWAWWP